MTVLPDERFSHNHSLSEETKKQVVNNFMNWHIGGLIHYNADMSDYVHCGNEYGDNHKQEGCQLKMSFNPQYHRYFEDFRNAMC